MEFVNAVIAGGKVIKLDWVLAEVKLVGMIRMVKVVKWSGRLARLGCRIHKRTGRDRIDWRVIVFPLLLGLFRGPSPSLLRLLSCKAVRMDD